MVVPAASSWKRGAVRSMLQGSGARLQTVDNTCQRREGLGRYALALTLAPLPNEVGHARVAARVTHRLDLGVQRTRRAPLALVLRCALHRLVQPLRYRVARQPRRTRYLALRLLPLACIRRILPSTS